MREELGDLLLLVLFHAKIAEREGVFDIADVMQQLEKKLRRRHPHVFGKHARLISPEDVVTLWNVVKMREKKSKKSRGEKKSAHPGARTTRLS